MIILVWYTLKLEYMGYMAEQVVRNIIYGRTTRVANVTDIWEERGVSFPFSACANTFPYYMIIKLVCYISKNEVFGFTVYSRTKETFSISTMSDKCWNQKVEVTSRVVQHISQSPTLHQEPNLFFNVFRY